nr:uncharacterized protein LOC104100328 [Nicotiana tomentosiformis]
MEAYQRPMAKDVHQMASLGVRLADSSEGGQVKTKHYKLGGLAQNIEIPMWKLELINTDFVVGLPCTPQKFNLIWVTMDRLRKSAHFLPVKATDIAEQYALLYIKDIMALFKRSNFVHRAMEKVKVIKERLKTAQSSQKSYSDVRHRDLEFQDDDRVFLKVPPMKHIIQFRKKGKLSPRYIRLYIIFLRVGQVAYRLELPPEMSLVHSVFHVSMLKKVVAN